MRAVLVVLVLAAVLLAGDGMRRDDGAPSVVVDGDAPDGGVYRVPPADLARLAGLPLDVYTLARVIQSESDSRSSEAERVAIAHVTRNQARVWGEDLTVAVTRGQEGGRGYYGAQNAGARWISSRFRPSGAAIGLADDVLNGVTRRVPDNTGGAVKFLHVATQLVLHQRDPSRTKHPDVVIADWRRSGFEPREIPGVSPKRFLVFVDRRLVA